MKSQSRLWSSLQKLALFLASGDGAQTYQPFAAHSCATTHDRCEATQASPRGAKGHYWLAVQYAEAGGKWQ